MLEINDKQMEIIEAEMANDKYIRNYSDLRRNGILDKLKEASEPYVSKTAVNIYMSHVRLSKDYNMKALCEEEKAKVRESEEYLFSKMWEANEIEEVSMHLMIGAILMNDEIMDPLVHTIHHFARILREKFIRMSNKSKYPGSEKEYRRALTLSKRFSGIRQ